MPVFIFYGRAVNISLMVPLFYASPQNSGGVLWFHVGRPCVCPSVRLPHVRPYVRISFLDDNLSKPEWIFSKLGMFIDIVEIWFGTAYRQISLTFDSLPATRPYFCLRTIFE